VPGPPSCSAFGQVFEPMLQIVLTRTARVVLPVFVLYTEFTLITERVGLDSVNRALTWPAVLLYVFPG
jgi:hypothetical protein